MDLSESSSWSVAQMGGAGRGSICCWGHGSLSVVGGLSGSGCGCHDGCCVIIEGSSFVKGNEVISSAGSARLD